MTKRGAENRKRAAAWLLSFVMLLSGSLSSPVPAQETEPALTQTESAEETGLLVEGSDAGAQSLTGEEADTGAQSLTSEEAGTGVQPLAAEEETSREIYWDETADFLIEDTLIEDTLIEDTLIEDEWLDAEAQLLYAEEELPDAEAQIPGAEEGWQDAQQDSPEAEAASDDGLFETGLPSEDLSEEQLPELRELQTVTDVWVNPVYENVVTPEDLIPDESVLQQAYEEAYQAAQETALLLEEQIGPDETRTQSAGDPGKMEEEPDEGILSEGGEETDEEVIFEGGEETAYFEAQDLLASEGYYFTDQTEALAAQLRGNLKSRMTEFSVGMAGDMSISGVRAAARRALLTAMQHTGEPTEGDYIRYQISGSVSAVYKFAYRETEFYQINFFVEYYTSAAQEKALDAAVRALLPSMRTGNAYSRVVAAYSHLTSYVKYDKRASSDREYYPMYTAYGALVDHLAVCQGYAVALYRLLLEMGIDCRIVDGMGVSADGKRTEEHAWNIIRIGNRYYCADATWDAGKPSSYWEWFLKGKNSTDFSQHILDELFDNSLFLSVFPISGKNYAGNASACSGHAAHSSKYVAAVAPLCEAVGYTQGTVCVYCGLTLSGREKISPAGHSWSLWGTVTPASISAPGLQLRSCTRCSKMQHRYVDKASPFITLSVKKATITLRRGRTRKIKVSFANGDRVVRYRSSRPKVVTVTKKGKLKAKKKGTAKITVTLLSGLKKSFRVRVR